MRIISFFNPDIYKLNYWRTRWLLKKHSNIVKHYISILAQVHLSDNAFDFSFNNRRLLYSLLRYAKKYSPYYKDLLENLYFKNEWNFNSIPFLTKEIIRSNKDRLKSKIIPDSLMYRQKTGGSTGEPLAFWSIGNTEIIHQTFLFKLHGYNEGDKILSMDGTVIDENDVKKNIFWVVKNNGKMLPYGGMALSSLYLNKLNIHHYINFILDFKPDFIRGYPAFISEIATYIMENKIELGFHIKAIEVTSETCTISQQKNIRKAFKTKVIGQYGHTEACVFAYTLDETMIYYCSPLYGFTEIIGDDDKHVDIGKEGEVVVTGFSSFGFPLIRYRTGDRAIYGGSKDGIIILNKILGRTADYILNDNNEKISLTALVFGQHYEAFSRINRWQIIQNLPGTVRIIIDRSSEYTTKDEEEILSSFYKIGRIAVEFDYEGNFIKTQTGKLRFVIQNIHNCD